MAHHKATHHAMLQVALECAQEAGAMVADAFSRPKTLMTKSSVIDLVTEWDKKAEELIFRKIRARFPDHRLIGEETHDGSGKFDLSDAPTWFIDPIDGTNNFCHGIPFVCVSVGASINSIPVVGVVYNPIMNEKFTAVAGEGAFLNGQPIGVSSCADLQSAGLCAEFGYERSSEGVSLMLNRLDRLLQGQVQSVRAFGSCALNMCSVAMGRLDAYFEGLSPQSGPKPWDFGAAMLIVKEAGGVLLDHDGSAFDMTSGRVLCASTDALAQQLIRLL